MLLAKTYYVTRMGKTVIETTGILDVLTYLIENKESEILATDLKNAVSNYQQISNILKNLEDRKMIEIIQETKPRKRKLISLTPCGEDLAKRLLKLNEEIEAQ